MADQQATARRRTFGPTVLAGVGAAGLAAVAGNQPWAAVDAASESDRALVEVALTGGSAEFPIAGALALVCLAAWGVLLVTRGRVRRAVAVVATVAAGGVLLATALGFAAVPDQVREAVTGLGVVDPDVSRTWWWWVAGIAGLVATAAGVAAVRWAPSWPEMGRKYDAPATRPDAGNERSASGPGPDLWRALDDGHDPTT